MEKNKACNNEFVDDLTALSNLLSFSSSRDRNEAETRHKIIDVILHDFLAWPRNRLKVEEFIKPGFADYVLIKPNNDHLLFIEAKKEGVFFELPIAFQSNETSCYIAIKKLITDEQISLAMRQVRTYCFDTGCEFACITNGHEWIFFKTFEKGKRWEDLQAFVIRKLDFFQLEYTKAINSLSFNAITEKSSLSTLLASSFPKDRSIYFPKEKIQSYAHPISANKLAATLRPVASRYFGVINDHDTDFMERCYVSEREYQNTFDGIHNVIQDSLSPYFQNYGVQQLGDTGKGGQLGGRLTKNLKNRKIGEVLVLFGGKGAGKSTFIKRLLHHNPPRWLRDHSIISIVDLLKVPENTELIRTKIWDGLVAQLDVTNILNSDREKVLEIFSDRYDVALKQDLSGLKKDSENFNLRLNDLIVKWKEDKIYCAKRLSTHWASQEKGVIVVVDNTDQYSSDIQDFCFSSAQEISNELNCIVLISMREERFYDSKIHGVLDAYQNSGFHISSPKPSEVFKKRLDYAISLLEDQNKRKDLLSILDPTQIEDSKKYLGILKREFIKENSPLNNFLTACAHGDTRLSLDLFTSFLLSGYTNVEEMINAGSWNFQIHQVIKPVMIPTRFFYDEALSNIPNIYQLRSARHSSHFTALRILRKLSKTFDKSTPSYKSIAELSYYFAETFNMVDDFEKNVDMLLKHGFVEANNRLDTFSTKVDSIKITHYGQYMMGKLAFDFTYFDLICTDCGIFREQICNYLIEAAKKEYTLFTKRERLERVQVRLDRVEQFLNYLVEEEHRENTLYALNIQKEEMFTYAASADFELEKTRISKSAMKQQRK